MAFMHYNNRAIGSVVAVALLLIVAVTAVVVFQNWYSSYSSSLLTQTESQSGAEGFGTQVERVVGDNLYFRNEYDNLSINKIELSGSSCKISGSYSEGMKSFDLRNCINNTGIQEVVVYTEEGVHSASVYVDEKVLSNTTSTASGSFITQWNTSLDGNTSSTEIRLPLQNGGTYNFTVSWGDGTNDTITSWNQTEVTHDYGEGGVYNVTITGTLEGFAFNRGNYYDDNKDDADKLLDIKQWGDMKLADGGEQFSGAENLQITANDTPDLSNISNMNYMFYSANSLNQSINDWDVSEVTSMFYTFYIADSFNQPLNNWDVSNVTDMYGMFDSAHSFNQSLDEWNTSNVTFMGDMFKAAYDFSQNISTWCVEQIGSRPTGFDTSSGFAGKSSLQPNWGETC